MNGSSNTSRISNRKSKGGLKRCRTPVRAEVGARMHYLGIEPMFRPLKSVTRGL